MTEKNKENKVERIDVVEKKQEGKQEEKAIEHIEPVETVAKPVKVGFHTKSGENVSFNATKVCEKPKNCPVNDWKVMGWIYKGKSDKTLKIVIKDSEGKNKTLGVFFPIQLSDLFTKRIRAIPIKYKEKPIEEEEKPKENIEKTH